MNTTSIQKHEHVGHGHAGHNHTHGMAKKTLRLAFFLTLIILCAGVVGGLLANSLALLSDAGHIVTDVFALGLAWLAAVQAERPADERKTFGYQRAAADTDRGRHLLGGDTAFPAS